MTSTKTEDLGKSLHEILANSSACTTCQFWSTTAHYCSLCAKEDKLETINQCPLLIHILQICKKAGLKFVEETPKIENTYEYAKHWIRSATPLTQLNLSLKDLGELRLNRLTTMDESLEASNCCSACARWGAFDDGLIAARDAGLEKTKEIEV